MRADAARAAELVASAKDRAENLMIVDLMRNDLARVSRPGSVRVESLFALERHPTVHHLVSTVTGRAAAGVGPADLMEATFPPGSITGAPKHQAMKVIAAHEPPRGPWCGSLFLVEADGGLTASVLIRTAAFEQEGDGGWRFRTLAGAGIVADSDPAAELAKALVALGISPQQATAFMSDEKLLDKVLIDVQSGQQLGVKGTPNLFINEQFYGMPADGAEGIAAILRQVGR